MFVASETSTCSSKKHDNKIFSVEKWKLLWWSGGEELCENDGLLCSLTRTRDLGAIQS